MVSVAQSVEHWIVAPVVVGSIPITHPNLLSRSIQDPPLTGRRLPRQSFQFEPHQDDRYEGNRPG